MKLPPPGAAAGANDNTREDIFKEIDILIGLEHPNVIFLKGGWVPASSSGISRNFVFRQGMFF